MPAFVVDDVPGKDPVHVVGWCPWCEDVHRHGAAGGGGSRSAHCHGSSSPLMPSGYNLDVQGRILDESQVVPQRLRPGHRLHRVLFHASAPLRAVLLRYLLGTKRAGSSVERRTASGRVMVLTAEAWVADLGSRETEGRGFIAMAALLYGVSEGIAAVRLLEALSFDTLDEEAAFAVADAIDAWIARGAGSGLRGVR